MIYVSTISTPKNTSYTSPVKTILEVTKGLIWLIEVEYPSGCCGLLKLQIFHQSYQLFPATPLEALRGDNVTLRYDDCYVVSSQPFELSIITWNEDTIYDHTVQVRIGLASTEAFMSRFMPSVTWDKFAEALAKATSEQEQLKEQSLKVIQEELPETEPMPPSGETLSERGL
jgi:hypothetical protein